MGRRIVGHHRRYSRKARSDVQIHQAAIQLGNGSAIFPAHSRVQRELRIDPPIVIDESVVDGLPEILIGVAEGDGAGVRNAQQKIGKVGARSAASSIAGERKNPAWILLRQVIEFLPAEIASKHDVMRAAIP